MKKIKHKFSGKSLLELKKEFDMGEKGFCSYWWFDEPFAKEKPPKGIYEIDFSKQLTNLNYDEQKEKLPKGFDFPHPAILAEAIFTHYKKTGERLLENWWSRTSVQSSGGYFVYVGYFDSDGLYVNPRYPWHCGLRFRRCRIKIDFKQKVTISKYRQEI